MAHVFLTGGTGFLGAHIARQLVAGGHTVRLMRRKSSRLLAIGDLPVEFVLGDLFDTEHLTKLLEGIDWVFHVAAVADYWRTGKELIYRVNVDGTRHLLEAAQRAGIKRFIFTSTVAAVGWRGDGHNADENTYFNISPRISPYGHSKFLAEADVQRAVEAGLDAVILNPAVILGPGDLNQISGSLIIETARGGVPALAQQGGTNFIDVRDVAAAHIAAAERGRSGERYILGGVNMTHKAFTRLVCDVLGAPVPRLPLPGNVVPAVAALADVGRALGAQLPADGNQLRLSRREIYFDTSKMLNELHTPQINIRQSVQDTYDWYRA
ncbi:MAG: NAD-dependent epimerase/dehydratase family protein, partial [Anaerolineales bacterium]